MAKLSNDFRLFWDFEGPTDSSISLEPVDHFDARGMRPVYGRGDHGWHRAPFEMNIWVTRNQRLFVRFSSRSQIVDWSSYELIGLKPGTYPLDTPKSCFDGVWRNDFNDDWIPRCLKEEYNDWIVQEA